MAGRPVFGETAASELHEPCGSRGGGQSCRQGLVCVTGECLGWISSRVETAADCAPPLHFKEEQKICIADYGEEVGRGVDLGGDTSDVRDNMRRFLNILLGFTGLLAVIMIIYGGALWMIARGDAEKIGKAKKIILWSSVGLFVILTAWVLTSYVLSLFNRVKSPSTGNQDFPADSFPNSNYESRFRLERVITARPTISTADLNQDLYRCSSLEAVFNTAVEAESFTVANDSTSADADRIRVLEGSTEVAWPLEVNDGQPLFNNFIAAITYEHLPPASLTDAAEIDNYLFKANTDYKIIIPGKLSDIYARQLRGCVAYPGCEIDSATNPPSIVWNFRVGDKTDVEQPALVSASPYYDAEYFNASSPPARDPIYYLEIAERPVLHFYFSEPILKSSLLVADAAVTSHGHPVAEMPEHSAGTLHVAGAAVEIVEIAEPTGAQKKNPRTATPTANIVPNYQFLASISGDSQHLQLDAISAHEKFLLRNNHWYRITFKGNAIKDFCGNYLDETSWLFQVNSLLPNLLPTPPDGMEHLCPEVEVGVVSTVSMKDPLNGGCEVPPMSPVGYVQSGALQTGDPAKTYTEVSDPAFADWSADTSGRVLEHKRDCRIYEFETITRKLAYNVWYQATVQTSYPLPAPQTGTLAKTWYFKTATQEEVEEGKCIVPPIIDLIKPAFGIGGQCVTIIGRHLAPAYAGAIPLTGPAAADQGSFITRKDKYDPFPVPPGVSIPPAGAANDRMKFDKIGNWTDTNITGAIPEGLNVIGFPQFNDVPVDQAEHPVNIVFQPDAASGLPAQYILSRAYPFRLNKYTDPAKGPCIYYVEPGDGHRGAPEVIHGDRFDPASDKKVRYDLIEDTIVNSVDWSNNLIRSVIPLVRDIHSLDPPTDPEVFVTVMSDSGFSNPFPITIPVVFDADLVNRPACDNYRRSPNPYPAAAPYQQDVCLQFVKKNGAVYDYSSAFLNAFFEINVPSIDLQFLAGSKFLDPRYYELRQCNDPNCNTYQATGLRESELAASLIHEPGNQAVNLLIYEKNRLPVPGPFLKFDTWYQLVFKDAAAVNESEAIIDDWHTSPPVYFLAVTSWKFKTIVGTDYDKGSCDKLKSVMVGLDPDIVRYDSAAMAEASGLNYQCQLVPGIKYTWSAQVPTTCPPLTTCLDPDDLENTASPNYDPGKQFISLPLGGGSNSSLIQIDSKNSYLVQSAAEIIADPMVQYANPPNNDAASPEDILTVRNIGYCDRDEDCKYYYSNCVSTCNTTAHRCFPKVTYVSPEQAVREEWISIIGCYFGDYRVDPYKPTESTDNYGKVTIKDAAGTDYDLDFKFPAQCPPTWSDSLIIGIVPPSAVPHDSINVQGVTVKTHKNYDALSTPAPQYPRTDDQFKIITAGKSHPMLCGINPQTGDVQAAVTLIGVNFDTDGTLNNEASAYSLDPVFTAATANEGPHFEDITSIATPAITATSKVAYGTKYGMNFVKALDHFDLAARDQAYESNPLVFQVKPSEYPKIIRYDPRESDAKPCLNQDQPAAYCRLSDADKVTTAVIRLDFNKALATERIVVLGLNNVNLCGDGASVPIKLWRDNNLDDAIPAQRRAINCQYLDADALPNNDKAGPLFVEFTETDPDDNAVTNNPGLVMGDYYYIVEVDQSLVTDLKGYPLDCGVVPTTASGKCQWGFVQTERVAHIELIPHDDSLQVGNPLVAGPRPFNPDPAPNTTVGQDGVIYTRTYLDINQDLEEYYIVKGWQYLPVVVNFADGEVVREVTLNLKNDARTESEESLQFSIYNPTPIPKAGLNTALAYSSLAILDDDNQAGLDQGVGSFDFSANQMYVSEGRNDYTIDIPVVRRNGGSGAVNLDYKIIGGTASSTADYNLAAAGTLQFSDHQLVKSLVLQIKADTLAEPVESIVLQLSRQFKNSWAELADVDGAAANGLVRALVEQGGVWYAGVSGSSAGLYVSDDQGQTWIKHSAVGSKQVNALVTGKNGTLYIGAVDLVNHAQILKLGGNGALTTFSGLRGNSIASLIQTSDGTILAAIDNHIFRGKDNGSPFVDLGALISSGEITKLLVLSNGDILAATNNEAKIYQSTDQGNNWTALTKFVATPTAGDTAKAILQTADGLLVGAYINGAARIYRSINSGVTWKQVYAKNTVGLVHAMIISNGVTYAGVGNLIGEGFVIKSYDNGINWTETTNLPSGSAGVLSFLRTDESLIVGTMLQGKIYQSQEPSISAGGQVTINIFDDGDTLAVPPPIRPVGTFQFTSPMFAVAENSGPAKILITRSGGYTGPASVEFLIAKGTATPDVDYNLAVGGPFGAEVQNFKVSAWNYNPEILFGQGLPLPPAALPALTALSLDANAREYRFQRVGNFIGTADISVKVGSLSASAPLKVADPAILQITDFIPIVAPGDQVCRNALFILNFNHPPQADSLVDNIRLYTNNSTICDEHWADDALAKANLNWWQKIAASFKNVISSLTNRIARAAITGTACSIKYKLKQSGAQVFVMPVELLKADQEYSMVVFTDKVSTPNTVEGVNWIYQGNTVGIDNQNNNCDSLAGDPFTASSWNNEPTCQYDFKSKPDIAPAHGICALDYIAVIDNQTYTPAQELIIYNDTTGWITTAQGFSGPVGDIAGSQAIQPIDSYAWQVTIPPNPPNDWDNWQLRPGIPKSNEVNLDPQTPTNFEDNDWTLTTPDLVSDYELTVRGREVDPATWTVNTVDPTKNELLPAEFNLQPQKFIFPAGQNQLNTDAKKVPILPLLIKVRPCYVSEADGPLGDNVYWEFRDVKDSANLPPELNLSWGNMEFGYCRIPSASSPKLSAFAEKAIHIVNPSARNVLREYFLRYDSTLSDSNDVILVRVFKAPEYFISRGGQSPLELWYQDNEAALFGGTKSNFRLRPPVDGYAAAEVSKNSQVNVVFVHALNLDTSAVPPNPKVYSNIYALAINEDASDTTRQIFKQIISNWRFNINMTTTNRTRDMVAIDAFRDDYQRINDLSTVAYHLKSYRSKNGRYPLLQHSRLGGVAVSTWGQEWRIPFTDEKVSLAAALDISAIPLDPDDREYSAGRSIAAINKEIIDNCLYCTLAKDQTSCEAFNTPLPAKCRWDVSSPPLPARCTQITDVYECLWKKRADNMIGPGFGIQACLITPADKTSASLLAKKLGFGVKNGNGNLEPSTLDVNELFACYDEEAEDNAGKYYCELPSPIYQYQTDPKKGDAFTLYTNFEYNSGNAIIWCQAWGNETDCLNWSGPGAGFCKWIGGACQVKNPVNQPSCAGTNQSFNIMYTPN